MKLRFVCVAVACFSLIHSAGAQSSSSSLGSAPEPPPLIQFSSVATDEGGSPLNGTVNITFSLYSSQQGGEPLWSETQSNVPLDSTGHYSVPVGITKPNGVPTTLFATGEARWMGVQIAEQAEQPRVLLVSVPYALKAGDAETVGGLPPSAFVLAEPNKGAASLPSTESAAREYAAPPPSSTVTGTGTVNYLPLWNSNSNIVSSVLFQSGTGSTAQIGIGTATPLATLEVKGSGAFVGDTRIDFSGLNKGSYTPGIRFGSGNTGEAIASDRKGTINGNGIDFYTDFTPRLSITNNGNVGIGTTTPTSGILTTVANSASVVGASVTGYNATLGSNANGYDGIHVTGGNGDPNPPLGGVSGGIGLVATGGATQDAFNPGGTGGAGIVANGGDGEITGPGLIANGGSDCCGAAGATGVIGNGGQGWTGTPDSGPSADGVGGVFTGGNTAFGGDGIDGVAGSGWAGNFTGDLNVSGTITAGTKDFKIDDPLDPANKYLFHASVESSEMKTIYDGNVTTDNQGYATVRLPEWLEALNTDFRYQLTVIGQFAQAIVASEIGHNQFNIRTDKPNVKVSWQVTGVRRDAYARAHPLVVEQQKETGLRGYYIHPELYGAPLEKQIEWARHPQMMKQLQKANTQQLAAVHEHAATEK
jgi:hypothetical protein